MARSFNRLSSTFVESVFEEGLYCDGNGLYLVVNASQSKQWIYRYSVMVDAATEKYRQQKNMGLGGYPSVSLAQARRARDELQVLRNKGIDPLYQKRLLRQQKRMDLQKSIPTFEAVSEELIKKKTARWKNDKHCKQWSSTLKKYAYPVIAKLPCDQITIHDIRKILDPIWQTKPTTADRVRNRIEAVLNYATVCGYRSGLNPAGWSANLEYVYDRVGDIWEVKHHPSMPYSQIPDLVTQLEALNLPSAQALVITILTAARTSEVRGMMWCEIDFDRAIWAIPAIRMKNKKIHRVPLSPKILSILELRKGLAESEYVFPGKSQNKFMSEATMNQLLKRLGHGQFVVHGFRSSFTDWAAEVEMVVGDVADKSLAHTVRDETKRAYYRTDLFNQRRDLMNKWANYCIAKCDKVNYQHSFNSNLTGSLVAI